MSKAKSKFSVRHSMKFLLNRSWGRVFLSASQTKMIKQGTPIFAFHKIGSAPLNTRVPSEYCATNVFESRVVQLLGMGLKTVTLDQLANVKCTPRKDMVLTFDDGYLSVLEQALPVLLRHGLCATQFLVSDFIGQQRDIGRRGVAEFLMKKSHIKEWLAAGQMIGSHSLSHRDLTKIPIAKAKEEIILSKKRLEDEFEVPVRHFSFPYGSWNSNLCQIVIEAGYETACTMNFGVNTKATSIFQLSRITPLSLNEILRKLMLKCMRR